MAALTWHVWHDTPRATCPRPLHCCRRHRPSTPAFCGCMCARRVTCMVGEMTVKRLLSPACPSRYNCSRDAGRVSDALQGFNAPVIQVLVQAEEHIVVLVAVEDPRGHLWALIWRLRYNLGLNASEWGCTSHHAHGQHISTDPKHYYLECTAASSPSLAGGAAGRATGASGLQSPYRTWLASSPSSSTCQQSRHHINGVESPYRCLWTNTLDD